MIWLARTKIEAQWCITASICVMNSVLDWKKNCKLDNKQRQASKIATNRCIWSEKSALINSRIHSMFSHRLIGVVICARVYPFGVYVMICFDVRVCVRLYECIVCKCLKENQKCESKKSKTKWAKLKERTKYPYIQLWMLLLWFSETMERKKTQQQWQQLDLSNDINARWMSGFGRYIIRSTETTKINRDCQSIRIFLRSLPQFDLNVKLSSCCCCCFLLVSLQQAVSISITSISLSIDLLYSRFSANFHSTYSNSKFFYSNVLRFHFLY